MIGGGLAGSEAAWQAARRGARVRLYEMRPARTTPAHRTDALAEVVCSNSFRSESPTSAAGVLKRELAALGSLVLEAAYAARVPAGQALAFDRSRLSAYVTERIEACEAIEVVREEVTEVPAWASPQRPVVVATGPLTSEPLADSLAATLGVERLSFFDAIAPIVAGETIDRSRAYFASRGGAPEDHLNLPLNEAEYHAFVEALCGAELHEGFDAGRYFEGCLPIEVMARRGVETLRHGPMKPWGLVDPRTGREPYAVVQCRREDLHGEYWNLVAFQTQMTHAAQDRVFRMIPALANARFLRHGSAHRNTFVDAPRCLAPTLEARTRPGLFVAGQLAGVEGYIESTGMGLLAGIFALRRMRGEPVEPPPETTILGGLIRYITTEGPAKADFQPMKANWALVPPIEKTAARLVRVPRGGGRRPTGKDLRAATRAERAERALAAWIQSGACR